MSHKLVLLRHGTSVWNLENIFTGFVDVDLALQGEVESKEAGRLFKKAGIHFDQVFTSTLKRAYRTAEIALREAGQEDALHRMIKHPDLRERDYGGLTGLNKDQMREKYGVEQVQIWRRSYDTPPPEGAEFKGESLKDVVENRVRPYFNSTIKPLLDQGKNILIAAHGNSLRGLLVILDQYTPENIHTVEIQKGSPLVLEMSEDGKVLDKYYLKDRLGELAL
jgi:2,3-bisphosphoglycerate-dependent phosphoglycerate mutase